MQKKTNVENEKCAKFFCNFQKLYKNILNTYRQPKLMAFPS